MSCESRMRRALCKFGHLIKSLTLWNRNGYFPLDMNVISKYCTGTVKQLSLEMFNKLDCNSAMTLFESLKELKINCPSGFAGNATGLFERCKILKKLIIIEIPNSTEMISAIVQHYPNLKELYIDATKLNLQTIFALLKQNPHIRKLDTSNHIAFRTVCLLANKLEIEELILRCRVDHLIYADEIGKLKSLKSLELHSNREDHVSVIEALRNNQLEHLKWLNCRINLEYMDSVLKLHTLTSLTLSPICLHFDEYLIMLAEQLPSLQNLRLEFLQGRDSLFTTNGLQSLVANSPKLFSLELHTHHATLFDQKFYDSLLKVIRKRFDTKKFTVTIDGSTATSIQMHSNLLHFNYVRKDCNCSKLHWSLCIEGQQRDQDDIYYNRRAYF